jgi:hypothetical protein
MTKGPYKFSPNKNTTEQAHPVHPAPIQYSSTAHPILSIQEKQLSCVFKKKKRKNNSPETKTNKG